MLVTKYVYAFVCVNINSNYYNIKLYYNKNTTRIWYLYIVKLYTKYISYHKVKI